MLKISKNGNLYLLNEHNGEWEKCNLNVLSTMQENGDDACILDEDLTLGDIFKLVEEYEEFLTEVIDADIPYFLDEMEKPSEKDSSIRYIEINWNAEEINGFLEESVSATGWTPKPDELPSVIGTDQQGNVPCGVGFTSVNSMRNVPLVLNHNYHINELRQEELENYIISSQENNIMLDENTMKGFESCLFSTKKHFTLIDILDALFFEITAFGKPEQRDAFKDRLIDIAKGTEEGRPILYTQDEMEAIYEEVDEEVHIVENNSDKDEESLLQEIDDIFEDIEDHNE